MTDQDTHDRLIEIAGRAVGAHHDEHMPDLCSYEEGEAVVDALLDSGEIVTREQLGLAQRARCIYCDRRWTADQIHRGHHDVCGDCHRTNQRARRALAGEEPR